MEPSRAAGNFALHPNGNLLANTENGSLRLWQLRGDVWADVELGDPQPSTPTGTVSFSPDRRRLVEVGAKGSLVVWDLDPNSWLSKACEIANRNLYPDEWRRYFPDTPNRKTCPNLP